MVVTKDDAVKRARADLAERLGVSDNDIEESAIEETDFPDLALGAPVEDEMSGQMMTRGWRICLRAQGNEHEYRANKDQVRLYNYEGDNYKL